MVNAGWICLRAYFPCVLDGTYKNAKGTMCVLCKVERISSP